MQFIITRSNDFLKNIIDHVLSKAVTLLCVKVELMAAMIVVVVVVVVVVVSTATALVMTAVVAVTWICIILKMHLSIKKASYLKTIRHHT